LPFTYEDLIKIQNAVEAAIKDKSAIPPGQKIVEQLDKQGYGITKQVIFSKAPIGRPVFGTRSILKRLTSAQLRTLATIERYDPSGTGIRSTTFNTDDRASLRRLLGYGYVERDTIKEGHCTLFNYKVTREGRLRLTDPEKLLEENWGKNE
jgi:hypothetical protein